MNRPPVIGCLLLTTALLLPSAAPAQDVYPSRPVRVLVGLAPGGATDIQARLFAQKLTESTGRSFVVENRAGAGATIAYGVVAKSPPDGYTLLGVAGGYATTPLFYPKLPYDPIRDFAPISLVAQAPFLLLVHPSLPVRTAKDLVALAKAKPGTLDFGSAGHGTSTGLALELFRAMANVKITHIPYKGTAQAIVDTVAGQVHGFFGNPLSSLTHVKAGKLRALGVTSAKRSVVLRELPTLSESGVPGYETTTWHGWLAPAGTPAAIVNRLNAELVRAAKAPDLAGKLAADAGEPVGSTPGEFAQHISAELARWRKVVKEGGVILEQ